MTCGRKIGPYDCCSVVQGDCLELMKSLPDASVDLIWTDPPYGNGNHQDDLNACLNEYRGLEDMPIANDTADSMRQVVDGMLRQASRVMKADCCCCCCGGGGPRPTFAWVADRMDRDGLQFFHSVIWDKVNPGLGWRYRRQHEMVMISHRKGGSLRWNPACQAVSNIVTYCADRERQHPNEKPLKLVEPFIYRHSEIGDLVIDPFCGSGTTAVAARRQARHFIGFELDSAYVDIARERIALVENQLSLFDRTTQMHQQCLDYTGPDQSGALRGELDCLVELAMLEEQKPW